MFIVKNSQVAVLKAHAEARYKKLLCEKKAARHNKDHKISSEDFTKRILTNYNTARYYGFTTKSQVEVFIDCTFKHEALNKPAPLVAELHRMLLSPEHTPTQKFKMIHQFFSETKLKTVTNA